ncbi:MAG: flagellar basal-body rod protein FlgF [Gammaproteobacteria bacterium]|jgi:flagellar basal-body rod protein FlgF|nr:flagellar basal-body rod protein FlgF [Gammaproteobacteria bacterium]MBU0773471.1 flagellar basal-body rod protein FlgF [Gammaproteobacteria bacterium]MBU0856681.1 flagellar basal-body rod protein FlgF [Gammaproteobacteria bacterium]MBU1846789.1 flagellar basal-body rod protein FlgF [Gammaproteobacteria bacterium]
MDALIYTAMSGAERALHAQQVRANNLANADTPGFRADLEISVSEAVRGYGYDARHMGRLQADTLSTRQGPMQQTDRDLDVAIAGDGFLAVQWGEGEAYTRAGALTVDPEGTLTVNGRPVMGEGGPIVLPPYSQLAIGEDGTISVRPPGQPQMQVVERLKLVRPDAADIVKNEAGLIVSRTQADLPADPDVRVRSGFLEGSNVSAVEEMVATMTLNREFEMQMKLYKAADSMAETGNRLIRE